MCCIFMLRSRHGVVDWNFATTASSLDIVNVVIKNSRRFLHSRNTCDTPATHNIPRVHVHTTLSVPNTSAR